MEAPKAGQARCPSTTGFLSPLSADFRGSVRRGFGMTAGRVRQQPPLQLRHPALTLGASQQPRLRPRPRLDPSCLGMTAGRRWHLASRASYLVEG